MEYKSPKYEITLVEAEDIITSSPDKYEIVEVSGTGSVRINASDIFK